MSAPASSFVVEWIGVAPDPYRPALEHAFQPDKEFSVCNAISRIKASETPSARRCVKCERLVARGGVLATSGPSRRRPRRDRPRSKTLAVIRITRESLRIGAEQNPPVDPDILATRPSCRGDCRGGQRPCPWVSCSHHLYLDVNPETGSIKINYPNLEPWELKETCSLDVAERGAITLEEVAEHMNLTRERVRQIEVRALINVKQASPSPDEPGADLLLKIREAA